MNKMKKVVSILLIAICCIHPVFAQQQERKQNIKPELRKGNELYKQKKYAEAQNSYMNALQKDPTSYTGMFNMGDALYKDKKFENARQVMSASAKSTKDKKEQAKSYHNIGNTFLEEKKWEEAINAYKQSLRLDPTDADTKYNLAYANAMLKKNGGNKNNKDKNKDKNDKDKKDQDKKDQDKKDQDKKDQDKKDQDKKDQDKKDGDPKDDKGDKDKPEQQPRPQGQPSKLSQQQAENLLNALRQEEKKLQDKKDKNKGVPVKLDKDW
jgi:tetratricopeptide (TPR) repeat protein